MSEDLRGHGVLLRDLSERSFLAPEDELRSRLNLTISQDGRWDFIRVARPGHEFTIHRLRRFRG